MTESLVDGCCTCYLGHPPCSYCVETYECCRCFHRVLAEDQSEEACNEELCQECWDDDHPPAAEDSLSGDALMESIRRASGGH